MIRAVFFDFDGTLRYVRPNGLEAFFAYAAELQLELCDEVKRSVERWVHSYWAERPDKLVQTGARSRSFWLSYVSGLLQASGIPDPTLTHAEAIEQAFEERYQPQTYIPEEAGPALGRLVAAGFTLGLVSNRAGELDTVAAEAGLSEYFTLLLSAGQANSWKPDPGIFLQACLGVGAAPHECVYVGDNYFTDVLGSRAAGLLPVLLDPRDVFPDAACPRVGNLAELPAVLEGLSAQAH